MIRKLIKTQISLTMAVLLLLPVFSFAETPQIRDYESQRIDLSSDTPATAQVSSQISTHASGSIRLVVNGIELLSDQKPILDGTRVLVPIRGIFELMQATVSWDPHTNTATIKKGADTLQLKVGSSSALINGKKYKMDIPPKLLNGRLLVPIRFISEHLDMKVNWNQDQKIVTISNGRTNLEKSDAAGFAFNLPHLETRFQTTLFPYHDMLYYCGSNNGNVQYYSLPLTDPVSSNPSLVLNTDLVSLDEPVGPIDPDFETNFMVENGRLFLHYAAGDDRYFQIGQNGMAQPIPLKKANAVMKPYGDSMYVYMSAAFGDSDLYLLNPEDVEKQIGDPYYNYIGNMIISGDSLFVTGFEKGDSWENPASSLWQINLLMNQIHQVAEDCSDVLGIYGNSLYFLSRDKKIQKVTSVDSKPILSMPSAPPVKLAKMAGNVLYFVDSSGGLNVLDLKLGTSKNIMKPSVGEITEFKINGNVVAAHCDQLPDCTLAVFDENGKRLFTTNEPVLNYSLGQNCLVYSVQGSDLVRVITFH